MGYGPIICGIVALGIMGIRCAQRPKVDPRIYEQAYKDSIATECKNSGGEMYGDGGGKTWCNY